MTQGNGSDTPDDSGEAQEPSTTAGRIIDEEGGGDSTESEGSDSGDQSDDAAESGHPDVRRLRKRVAELEAELETSDERIADLEGAVDERDEQIETLQRELAKARADVEDLRREKKEAKKRVRRRTTDDVSEEFCDVRDNLVRALGQGEDTDIRGGVEATLKQFDDVLDANGIRVLNPSPGDEVDPVRHEVVDRVEGDQPAGTVQRVFSHGYEQEERVIRAAKIAISTGDWEGDDEDESGEEADEE